MDPVFSQGHGPQIELPPEPTMDNRPATPGRPRRFIILGLVTLTVVCLGAGAYWWTHRQKPAPPAQSTDAASTAPAAPDVTPDTVTASSMSQYVSNGTDLNLSFTYPSGWTVSPATNTNTSDQAVTLTSPLVTIADATGKSITSRVVVSIRPTGSTLSELAGNKATAGQSSAQIGYDKPTSSQHQYPFLSYIHLAGGTNPGSVFEEVMITGSMSFTKDQAIAGTSLAQLDPVISARFYACSDQACAAGNSSPLSITNSTWTNDATCMQTLAIFKSLQIN